MDIETRLAAIEETQNRILKLLTGATPQTTQNMTLKEAAEYVGFSPDHFRRLAVEQRIIPFSRPSKQQKGKLLFRKTDLDNFLENSCRDGHTTKRAGRKRLSPDNVF